MKCAQPGCRGVVVDGYCDVCGLAPSASVAPAAPVPSAPGQEGPAVAVSSRLGTAPLGSARVSSASRSTRRLGTSTNASRLGAGITQVPPIPEVDPRQALMDPAVVAEEKRFCNVCQAPVGRSREGVPGRTKGFCAKCRTPFDFEPTLKGGDLLGGQYEVVGCLAHGGMGWVYLARDRNVNDRWVVLKGLLNAGDPDASRAAVAEKHYLAEVEHPLIVEIYNFVTARDGNSYIVMEYVGGRSLNNLLKDRMRANGGAFSAIPVDQAIAYIVEILPAFSYLHSLGLLYCDFKPANIIQVGDSIKLIDLGGVRRVDDDTSPIYGTVGFQAPEVAREGTTVASDLYTIARTLAVLVFEFKGYQSEYETTLPTPDQVPLFGQYDSLYRWLVKGTAPRPEDRFQTAEDMRGQLMGVLREVAATSTGQQVTRSTPSSLFSPPGAAAGRLAWSDLPLLAVDPADVMASWLAGVTADQSAARVEALAHAPMASAAVLADMAWHLIDLGDTERASALAHQMLTTDPWEWRGVWTQGLVAYVLGTFDQAVAAFNTVYGDLPGELAPKLALAASCEAAGETAVADRLYAVCAATDAAYVAVAQFGRARLAGRANRVDDALAALARIPATSRAYSAARLERALLFATTPHPDRALDDLSAASTEADQASLAPSELATLRVEVLKAALVHVQSGKVPRGSMVSGVPATEVGLRSALEAAYRDLARVSDDSAERIAYVDLANEVRPRTFR